MPELESFMNLFVASLDGGQLPKIPDEMLNDMVVLDPPTLMAASYKKTGFRYK